LDPVLDFFCANVLELLGLDDVAKITSISVPLKFIQQMKLVLLELFDSLVEATDTLEHVIVLPLESLHILVSLVQLVLELVDLDQ
jgi:hypothetical protein